MWINYVPLQKVPETIGVRSLFIFLNAFHNFFIWIFWKSTVFNIYLFLSTWAMEIFSNYVIFSLQKINMQYIPHQMASKVTLEQHHAFVLKGSYCQWDVRMCYQPKCLHEHSKCIIWPYFCSKIIIQGTKNFQKGSGTMKPEIRVICAHLDQGCKDLWLNKPPKY